MWARKKIHLSRGTSVPRLDLTWPHESHGKPVQYAPTSTRGSFWYQNLWKILLATALSLSWGPRQYYTPRRRTITKGSKYMSKWVGRCSLGKTNWWQFLCVWLADPPPSFSINNTAWYPYLQKHYLKSSSDNCVFRNNSEIAKFISYNLL